MQFIQAGRGAGKTYAMMQLVKEAIDQGFTVKIVSPNRKDRESMMETAEELGIELLPEHFVTAEDLVRRPGRFQAGRAEKVFIDDADQVLGNLLNVTMGAEIDTATLGSLPTRAPKGVSNQMKKLFNAE